VVEVFNHERPHEALGMKRPAEVYVASARPYSPKPATYPLHDLVVRVTTSGHVRFPGTSRHERSYFIAASLAGHDVGLRELDDGRWLISFFDIDLGLIDRAAHCFTPATENHPSESKLPEVTPADSNENTTSTRSNNRSTNKETTNKETTNKETTNKETTNKETANKETTNKKTANKKTTNKETTNKETTNKETANREATNERTTNEEAAHEKTTNEKTTNEKTGNGKTRNNKKTNNKTDRTSIKSNAVQADMA
jgi:hypothetical protein